jgi:AraC family transcriptional regulator
MLSVNHTSTTREIVQQSTLADRGITIMQAKANPGTCQSENIERHMLVLYEAPDVVFEQRWGAKKEVGRSGPGKITTHPSGEYGRVTWKNPMDNIFVFINQSPISLFAETRFEISQFSLKDHFLFLDPFIGVIIKQILFQNQQPYSSIGSVYKESLCDTLFYHLIQNFGRMQTRIVSAVVKFSPSVMASMNQYILENMDQVIKISELAAIAHSSIFHFTRRFKKSTGSSPYQYILHAKFLHAKQMLSKTNLPIGEVAYMLGFTAPSHFDSFFKNQTGYSPSQFRML